MMQDFPARVLLVDDHRPNLVALRAILGASRCEPVLATSGEEALRLLRGEEFALALVDVCMPGVDGFELARRVRDEMPGKGLPIIFVTALQGDTDHVHRGYAAGCVDYLVKPLDPVVVRGKVATFVELHRRRLAEQEARRARLEAESALRVREETLAAVSHDLKGPLSTIALSAGRLERVLSRLGVPAAEYTGALTPIERAVTHMDRLVEDLLDVERLRAGRLALQRRAEMVGSLLLEAIELHEPVARARSIRLEGALPRDLERLEVACDRGRVVQVLSNLLANAIKHSPDGAPIEVRAERADGGVRLSIRDRGPGIAPELASRLFQRYERGPGQGRGATANLGLGLAIARGLVEAHGGTIGVESAEGEGSTFHFTLPVPAPAALAVPAQG